MKNLELIRLVKDHLKWLKDQDTTTMKITDKMRLDWFTDNLLTIKCRRTSFAIEDGEVWAVWGIDPGWHKTIRNAIDYVIISEKIKNLNRYETAPSARKGRAKKHNHE